MRLEVRVGRFDGEVTGSLLSAMESRHSLGNSGGQCRGRQQLPDENQGGLMAGKCLEESLGDFRGLATAEVAGKGRQGKAGDKDNSYSTVPIQTLISSCHLPSPLPAVGAFRHLKIQLLRPRKEVGLW